MPEFDQLKYIAQYNKENIAYRKVSFNRKKPEDVEIMEWIDSQEESVSSYLKRLAKQDMEARRE